MLRDSTRTRATVRRRRTSDTGEDLRTFTSRHARAAFGTRPTLAHLAAAQRNSREECAVADNSSSKRCVIIIVPRSEWCTPGRGGGEGVAWAAPVGGREDPPSCPDWCRGRRPPAPSGAAPRPRPRSRPRPLPPPLPLPPRPYADAAWAERVPPGRSYARRVNCGFEDMGWRDHVRRSHSRTRDVEISGVGTYLCSTYTFLTDVDLALVNTLR